MCTDETVYVSVAMCQESDRAREPAGVRENDLIIVL